MEDDGAVSSPEESGVLDAEVSPAVVDGEEQVDNDLTAADDEEEEKRAAGRRRAREGKEEEEEGVLKDPPYEYPTGLVEVDEQ